LNVSGSGSLFARSLQAPIRALRIHGCCSLASNSFPHSFPKILSGLNAFEISNLQEQETESRYPGDPDVTMLHGAVKLLNGVFADHTWNA
jgi:hypothetical protein